MSQHTPAIQRPRRCPRSGVRALGRLKTRIARERALHCVCRTNMDPFTTLRRSERGQLENVVKTQSLSSRALRLECQPRIDQPIFALDGAQTAQGSLLAQPD